MYPSQPFSCKTRLPAIPPETSDRVLLLAKLGSRATVRRGRFMLKTWISGLEREYTATCPKDSKGDRIYSVFKTLVRVQRFLEEILTVY